MIKNIFSKPLIVLTVLLFFLSLNLSCNNNPPPKKLDMVNLAFQKWVGYGPFFLGKELGIFKDEGIDLNIVDEPLDSARREAFKEGMLDAEAGTIDLLVSKLAYDTPITMVLEIDYSFGADGIVVDGTINNIFDLKGKKVGLVRDDVGEMFISYVFNENGLSLNDISSVPTSPEEIVKLFTEKEVDAVVTWEPNLSLCLKREGSRILVTTKNNPGVIIDVLSFRNEIIKNNPQLAMRLMRGWFKSLKYYRENPAESSRIIAPHYGLKPEEYQAQVLGLRWLNYEDQNSEREFKEWEKAFNFISDIKHKNVRIPVIPKADTAINTSLLRSLYYKN
ncbi:MAG: ABC transporter substrate-binding protein [Candidatus Omnitrophica bacterium]|nr:ABC transporter substrate-binding protein [Candidatus Omnitrophota bacterium]